MQQEHEEGVLLWLEQYPLLVHDLLPQLKDCIEGISQGDDVPRPKIQPVPGYMGARVEFEKFYMPKLISVGPMHRFKPYVDQGEQYKLKWTAMYLKDTDQTAQGLCRKILDELDELKQLFSSSSWTHLRSNRDGCNFDNDDFMWMFLVDGCSVLQLLDKSNHDDPEQVLKVSIDQLVRVHQDLLLLENQLPFQLFKILCNDEAKLKNWMHNFLQIHGIVTRGRENENENTGGELPKEHRVIVQHEDNPIHLLDYLRTALLNTGDADQGLIKREIKTNKKSLRLRKYRTGTIRELKAAGIRVKKHPHNTTCYPNFVAGQLQLPELTVDGSTALTFLNLIAYEMCPDFRNDFEISSYIVFLSSLIDQPEDVKELRSAGILHNELASDKEVADIFNKMDTVLVPETVRFANIKAQIEAHFESKRGKIKMLGWMGEAYSTFFRSPWTIIALLAAALGLVLTFIQTWFAIHPKGP